MFEFFFYFSAIIVLPFWFAMIFFPGKKFTADLLASPWIIIPPVICYLYFLLPNLNIIFAELKVPSPAAMAKMMSQQWGAGMYWAYAGAFDLFVGRWIFFNAKEKEITHWLVSPILFVSIFFGPLGFFLYAVVRLVKPEVKNDQPAPFME